MKKGKIGTAFQGPEAGGMFSNKDHAIGSFCLFVFSKPETKQLKF